MPIKLGDKVFQPNKDKTRTLFTGIVISVSKTGYIVKTDDGKELFLKVGMVEPVTSGSARDGVKGNKGDKGDKGERGFPAKGGKDGKDGKDGKSIKGKDGRSGKDGKNAKDGKKGDKGDKGGKGDKGDKVELPEPIMKMVKTGGGLTKTRADELYAPGGNDTEVQFKDGGSFGGDSGFTYNKATGYLTAAGFENIGDFVVKLGDAAGANEFSLRDSDGNSVASINSDGLMTLFNAAGDFSEAIFDISSIATSNKTFTFPNTTGTLALTADKLSAFAATTSAELAGVISDETGSGALVFGTSPTFTTQITVPLIVTPAATDLVLDPVTNVVSIGPSPTNDHLLRFYQGSGGTSGNVAEIRADFDGLYLTNVNGRVWIEKAVDEAHALGIQEAGSPYEKVSWWFDGSSGAGTGVWMQANANAGDINMKLGAADVATYAFKIVDWWDRDLITFNSLGGAVFNEVGKDADFRVEGDTETNLLFIDASTDRVGIGTATPNAPLEVKGAKPGGNVGGFQSGMFHVTGSGTAQFSNSVITGHSAYGGNTQLWYLGSLTSVNDSIGFINRQNAPIHFSTNNALKMIIDAAGNVGIGTATPGTKLHVAGGITSDAEIRASTTLYRRYYHLSVGGFDPGISGATWTDPDANHTGGWRLNAVGETLIAGTDIHADWDGASDIMVGITFALNAAGSAGDTVDLKLVAYYNGVGDTATKTQIVEVATTTDGTQYKVYKATFAINHDEVGNVVDVGDNLTFILNLETDTSEIDDIIVLQGLFYYNTTHLGIESGDV